MWENILEIIFTHGYTNCSKEDKVHHKKYLHAFVVLYNVEVIFMLTILSELTHLPLDKMAAILQVIFSDAFLWTKSFVFLLNFPEFCS